jgi:hypothetical protein
MDLILPASKKTPSVHCQMESGLVTITGNCVPEDAISFFVPLKDWLAEFAKTEHPKIKIVVKLDYFSTSTARILLNLFRYAITLKEGGKELEVIWKYDSGDDDIREAGENYKIILGDDIHLRETSVS